MGQVDSPAQAYQRFVRYAQPACSTSPWDSSHELRVMHGKLVTPITSVNTVFLSISAWLLLLPSGPKCVC